MNLFKWRKKQPEPVVRAIFDVRPRSISVALVEVCGQDLRVLWSWRQAVRTNEHEHGDLYRRAIKQTLEDLYKKLYTAGQAHLNALSTTKQIESVHFVLSSPWSHDQIVTSRISQPRHFQLHRDHVYSAGRLAYNEFSHDGEYELLPLAQRVTGLYGDGRLISFPHEAPVRELELHMHVSKLPKDIKLLLEDVTARFHHPHKLSFHSSADVTSRVFSRAFAHPTDFLIVLPEHTQTDLILVEDGRLQGVTSVPIGEDFLLQAMSQAFGRPAADIRSRLNLHHRQKLSNQSHEMTIALEEIGGRWRELLHAAIGKLTKTAPTNSYLLLEDREHKAAFEDFFLSAAEELPNMDTYVVDQDLFTDHFLEHKNIDCTLAVSILGVEVY